MKYLFLFQAVKHLHDHNLVHMDIKSENIFLSFNDVCKLGDFGLVLDLSKVGYLNYLFCICNWCTNLILISKIKPE